MFANSWKGKYSGKITRGQTSGSQSLRRKKQARVVCKNDVWESGGNLRGFCSRLRGKPPVLGATTGGMPRAPYNIGRPHTRTQLVGLVANCGIEIRTTKQRHNNFQQRLRNKKTLAHNCKQLTASLGNQQFFSNLRIYCNFKQLLQQVRVYSLLASFFLWENKVSLKYQNCTN